MRKALAIIKDEHRSLAAVVHGANYLVDAIEKGRIEPNMELFAAIFRYLREFPNRLHHPKEDQYLFRLVETRTKAASNIIADLHGQHLREHSEIDRLEGLLKAFQEKGMEAFPAFAEQMRRYVDLQFQHIRIEEGQLIPIAQRSLTEGDWDEIETAFSDNKDPLIGAATEKEFRDLFDRILQLAPAPIGLGR